jgi:hypothetical protein
MASYAATLMATGQHKLPSNPQRHERQKLKAFATVTIDHDKEAILLDLSDTGLRLQTTAPLTPGTEMYLSFMLPESFTVVEGAATGVWSDASGQAGVKFLDEDMQQLINDWVEKAAKKAKRKTASSGRRPTVH